MNPLIINLAKIFDQESNYNINKSTDILDELFHCRLINKDTTIDIVKELFLRPYLTSQELTRKFHLSKEEIIVIYRFIQESREIKELFKLSSYPYFIQVVNELIKDRERTLQIIKGDAPFPLTETMELFISELCNAKCTFCYRNDAVYNEKKEMLQAEEFTRLINEFAEQGGNNLDVCGGLEPLLGPSLVDVLRTGLQRNLRVSLYTNGIELNNPDFLEHLLKIDRIRVSLNAHDRISYKKIVGIDKFDEVGNNISNLLRARERTRSSVRVGINFMVFQKNYTKIFDVIRLAEELGVDFLDLRSIHVNKSGVFDDDQKTELKSIIQEIKAGVFTGRYGALNISIADTFNFIFAKDDFFYSFKVDFAKDLVNYRVTVTPHGKAYALNVIAQPTRENPAYLLGEYSQQNKLVDILQRKKSLPFEPHLMLPHDISIIGALSRLAADLEYGISFDECPFNFIN